MITSSCPAALVTGGSRRLGKAIALRLAHEGYDIALHYNTSKEDALQTKLEIERTGQACHLFQAKLNDADMCSKLIHDVIKTLPNITVLINNASIFNDCDFEQTDEAIFNDYMNIHVKVPFFLTQNFAISVKKGHVINMVDSMTTKISSRFFTYLLTKKALVQLTEMCAKILAPHIRVNAIAPGSVLTALDFQEEYLEKKRQEVPLGYTPTPDEITDAVMMVLTNNYLLGQTIFVDSGERYV